MLQFEKIQMNVMLKRWESFTQKYSFDAHSTTIKFLTAYSPLSNYRVSTLNWSGWIFGKPYSVEGACHSLQISSLWRHWIRLRLTKMTNCCLLGERFKREPFKTCLFFKKKLANLKLLQRSFVPLLELIWGVAIIGWT